MGGPVDIKWMLDGGAQYPQLEDIWIVQGLASYLALRIATMTICLRSSEETRTLLLAAYSDER